jgi:hypothetical protein
MTKKGREMRTTERNRPVEGVERGAQVRTLDSIQPQFY